jgi:hypothetical protein
MEVLVGEDRLSEGNESESTMVDGLHTHEIV